MKDLGLTSADQYGKHFETGAPVRFRYARMPGGAPAPTAADRFQQRLEPAGLYVILVPDGHQVDPPWESGWMEFENPLVLAFNHPVPRGVSPSSAFGYDDKSWKARLHRMFGVTGRELSGFLRGNGYDGVVTVVGSDVREVVSLKRGFKTNARRATLRQNPKVTVKFAMADGSHLRDFIAEEESSGKRYNRDVVLTHRSGEPMTWWGHGSRYLVVDRERGIVWLHHPLTDLTQAWVLAQVSREMPRWNELELWRLDYTLGSGKRMGSSLGTTLGEYARRLREVRRSDPRYAEEHEQEHEYLAHVEPEDSTWYHATPARNLPAIMRQGLLPSRIGEGQGWTPAWNWHVQNGVYLTEDLEVAYRIADSIVEQQLEDVVILEVYGRALKGKKLLVDEDALRNEDGGVDASAVDTDFPDWESSRSHRMRSLAVADTIPPRFLEEVLRLHANVTYYDAYGDETDDKERAKKVSVDVELTGRETDRFAEGDNGSEMHENTAAREVFEKKPRFYHGSPHESGKRVLRDGVVRADMRTTGDNLPLPGRVYVTSNFRLACDYARMTRDREAQGTGYVFEVRVPDDVDVIVDEDMVGRILGAGTDITEEDMPWLWQLAKRAARGKWALSDSGRKLWDVFLSTYTKESVWQGMSPEDEVYLGKLVTPLLNARQVREISEYATEFAVKGPLTVLRYAQVKGYAAEPSDVKWMGI
jgi:hypothetical protein